jgi:hypothetical protein
MDYGACEVGNLNYVSEDQSKYGFTIHSSQERLSSGKSEFWLLYSVLCIPNAEGSIFLLQLLNSCNSCNSSPGYCRISRFFVSGTKSIPMTKVTSATMMGYQRPA